MLTFKETLEDTSQTSAFQKVGKIGKTRMYKGCGIRKRDSGYGSDFSPASVSSTSNRKSTTSENVIDLEISDALNDFNVSDDNVFIDSFDVMFNVISESDGDEEIDKEVETFLNNTQDKPAQLSDTSRPQRPSAPIPDYRNANHLPATDYGDIHMLSVPPYHACQTSRDRHVRRYAIPSEGRSIGTQTSSLDCQLMTDLSRGETILRNCTQSESHLSSLLPDIVLTSRDKSISLKIDVQSFLRREQEQRVGRELRRISDEFQSSYLRKARPNVKRRSFTGQPLLFPFKFGIDLYSYWNTFRRVLSYSCLIFSAGSEEQSEDDRHCS